MSESFDENSSKVNSLQLFSSHIPNLLQSLYDLIRNKNLKYLSIHTHKYISAS